MTKLRHWPQYLLAALLALLVFFIGWTYYLGTPAVTFSRLVGIDPTKEISHLTLRRYPKNALSPHLFTIETDDENAVVATLVEACGMRKIPYDTLDAALEKIDPEMTEVISRSPYIYQSRRYDLHDPKKGRLCVLFRDSGDLYLFINGNYKESL